MRGDQIMGYLTRGRGVSVHRLDCPNMIRLLKDEAERCVAASWNAGTTGSSIVELDVVAQDRSGLLADALKVLTVLKISPMKIEAGVNAEGTAHIGLRLSVTGNAVRRAFSAVTDRIPNAQTNVAGGISVQKGETQAAVEVTVVVEYGVSIVEVADAIRRNIIEQIEGTTGLEVVEVNINVTDVHLPDDDSNNSEAADLK